jgi:hypothetical protein
MLTRATTTNLSTRSLAGTPVRERAVARSTGRCVERTNERPNERTTATATGSDVIHSRTHASHRIRIARSYLARDRDDA